METLTFKFIYVMLCAIWYHLHNLKNVKNTHAGVLLLVKLQASACSFTKSNTPLWVFFTFLKLSKSYEIAQTVYIFTSWEAWRIINVKLQDGSVHCNVPIFQ